MTFIPFFSDSVNPNFSTVPKTSPSSVTSEVVVANDPSCSVDVSMLQQIFDSTVTDEVLSPTEIVEIFQKHDSYFGGRFWDALNVFLTFF
ncbi:MAG: hypothetical protein LBG58_16955, partial [Planctomycetaceae bacterium]|nr:hypothetical protein [Planctomycetaceae bacterium]